MVHRMELSRSDISKLQLAGEKERALINSLFSLFRTAVYVEPNNDTYLNQSAKFYRIFRKLTEETGKVIIKVIDGRILICEKLVKFDSDGMVRARHIVDTWYRLGIGGIILEEFLDSRQIDKFIYLIASLNLSDHDQKAISERLVELGIDGITLLGIEVENKDKPTLTENQRVVIRRAARSTFFRAISTVEDIMVRVSEDKEIDISKTRRVVHSLIDRINADEASLIELTSIRDFDEYTFAHCTNVCVYSLTMGVRLALDRQRLSELGFAALFHDLGKVRLPDDLIRKSDVYDENDWIQMQKHPHLGAKTILRNMPYDRYTSRAAQIAFEHHINIDNTGYPVLKYNKPVDLFSQIVSIADTFDALSSGRVYIKKSIPPDEVLRKMMYQMTIKFDPFLLKLFANVIGIYPAGTLLRLSTDELVVVSETNPDNLSRPKVRIIGNKSGPLKEYVDLDLLHPDNENRRVVRIINPQTYNIDIKQILLSE
jgi:HD-GYP domain-containing protein (c-di-GMP phosphodiesterase class II)